MLDFPFYSYILLKEIYLSHSPCFFPMVTFPAYPRAWIQSCLNPSFECSSYDLQIKSSFTSVFWVWIDWQSPANPRCQGPGSALVQVLRQGRSISEGKHTTKWIALKWPWIALAVFILEQRFYFPRLHEQLLFLTLRNTAQFKEHIMIIMKDPIVSLYASLNTSSHSPHNLILDI